MNLLVRWSATLGLVGSTLLGSWLGFSLDALALPEEEVVQKLRPVPVFTIADDQGAPLVATGENNTQVAFVFLSREDAQTSIEQLQQKNPELGSKVKVVLLSLGEVYQLAREGENDTERPDFNLVPDQQQVETAQTLISQQNQQADEFRGVPLFFATVQKDQKEAYLSYREQNSEQQRIPLFFEKERLQALVDQFKKQEPEVASTIQIKVVPLEYIIETFRQQNDEALQRMILVPSAESIEYVRSLQQQPNNAQQQPPNPAQ